MELFLLALLLLFLGDPAAIVSALRACWFTLKVGYAVYALYFLYTVARDAARSELRWVIAAIWLGLLAAFVLWSLLARKFNLASWTSRTALPTQQAHNGSTPANLHD